MGLPQRDVPGPPKRKPPDCAQRQSAPRAGAALQLSASQRRRCRYRHQPGSAATAGSNARPATGAVIRLRRICSRHVTAECAFFGAPPHFFPTQGKKCHKEKFRIRGSSYRMNTVQNSVEKREAVSQDRFKGQAKPPYGCLFSPASLPLFPRFATPRRSRGGLSAASVAADITVKAPFHRAVDSSTACQG